MAVEIPPYLVKRQDGAGRWKFHFQVPKRHRPDGWPGALRLPLDGPKRTGRGDHEECMAAIADAEKLYQRLQVERQPTPTLVATPGTIPALIDAIMADDNQTWAAHPRATKKSYRSTFKAIRAWSQERGDPPLLSFTFPDFVAFLGRWKAKPSMQHLVKAGLRYVFRQAKIEGLTLSNPIDGDIPMAVRPKAEALEWTDEDVEAFCARAIATGRRSLALGIRFKWWNAMRNIDIIGLTIGKDVRRSAAGWTVARTTSKRKRAVIVRLTPDVVDLLEAEIGKVDDPAALIRPMLIDEKNGEPYSEDRWNHACKEVRDAIGLSHLRVTWLRHTVMTELEVAGVPTAASASLVGHAPASHERLKDRHYRILNEELAEQATSGLEELRAARKERRTKV